MSQSLADKVVVITGASSGIGAAAAGAFACAGARVVLAARDANRLNAIVQELGGPSRALAVPTDVTRSEDCEKLARLTAQQFGRIDILVNNAGIGHWAKFPDLTEDEIRRIMEVNVLGLMNSTRAVLPWMRQQRSGVILNIASTVAHMGIPMMSVYCASKFAVRGFSQAMRLELAPDGIQVVCFCPGTTETEFFKRSIVRNGEWQHGLCKPMPAPEVGRRLVEAAVHPRAEIVLTSEGKALSVMVRHFPRLTDWLTRKVMQR